MRSIVPRRVPGQRVREYLRLQAAWGRGAAGEDELSRPRRTRAGFAGMSGVCAPRFSLIRAPDRAAGSIFNLRERVGEQVVYRTSDYFANRFCLNFLANHFLRSVESAC